MSAKHTQGPWKAVGQRVNCSNKLPVADVTPISLMPDDRAEAFANARLIAAAPDLLAALKQLLVINNLGAYEQSAAMKAARAAIAKAEAQQ